MYTNKYLEYYLDSKVYTNEEVQKSINETKKEFPNKNIKVNVSLNQFGVYIITFEFENKNTYFNKIKILFRRKKSNKLRQEEKENKKQFNKYFGNNLYGKYKSTGIYRPY